MRAPAIGLRRPAAPLAGLLAPVLAAAGLAGFLALTSGDGANTAAGSAYMTAPLWLSALAAAAPWQAVRLAVAGLVVLLTAGLVLVFGIGLLFVPCALALVLAAVPRDRWSRG